MIPSPPPPSLNNSGDLHGSHGFKVEVTQKWSPELLVEILRFPPTQRWSNIMVRV